MNQEHAIFARVFPTQIRKGDRTKLKIIQATIKSLSKESADALTYDSVGKHLHIDGAQIKYHFKSKDELIFKAVEFMLQTAQEIFISKIAESKTPQQRIQAIIKGLFTWADEHPEQHATYLYFFYKATHDKGYRALHTQMLKTGFSRIVSILSESKDHSHLSPAKLNEISYSIWSSTLGLLIYYISSDINSRQNFKASALKAAEQILKK